MCLSAAYHRPITVITTTKKNRIADLDSDAFFAASHELGATALMGNLAKAQLATARADESLATINDAMDRAGRTGEQFYVAELHRLRGDALLASDAQNRERARDCFETACKVASAQGARSLELRARTSLAGLLQKWGDPPGARQALVEILESFSEGFDTDDLKRAQSMAATLV